MTKKMSETKTEYITANRQDCKVLKGSRSLLLKNEENLSDKQRQGLFS